MTETTVHKATQPCDFLVAVPALLGYEPSESVVVVPFNGPRSIGAMRFDLPDVEDAATVANVAAGLVCKVKGATGLAVVVYGERAQAEAVGDAISGKAAQCGLSVVERFYVTGSGWGLIGDDAVSPMPEVPEHLTAMVKAANQHAGAEIPEVDPSRVDTVADAFDSFGLADVAEADWIALGEVAATTQPEEIDPLDAVSLIFAISRPSLRDIALVQWATDETGGERAAEAQAGWECGEEYPADLAAIMWGEAPRPDVDRLFAALATIRHLAALTPESQRAGLLAAAAWLSWALGRSTHADDYARQALAVDPGHGLAEIVASFVQASHLPSWVF